MTHPLHIVVGMPGSGIRQALQKLAGFEAQRGTQACPKIISVEDMVRPLAAPFVKDLFGLDADAGLAWLLLPKSKLRDIWLEAFAKACKLAHAKLAEAPVILTMHLCYYHHLTREYLSPANLEALRDLLPQSPECVVTLIDDIYDCQRRLSDTSGAFAVPRDYETAAFQTLTALDWRSMETLLADELAHIVKVDHVVFAVKHPLATFHDLLYSSKQRAYISHPISEPRRLEANGRVQEARDLVAEIEGAVHRLRASYVLFEPTAIDELRFELDSGAMTGRLTPRWPLARATSELPAELLWSPPAGTNPGHGFPAGWETDDRRQPSSPALARLLFDAIGAQVDARDHALVEQSQRVICYRPLFRGNASTGVQEELEHEFRLVQLSKRSAEPLSVVLNPLDDESAYQREQMVALVRSWYKEGKITGEDSALSLLLDRVGGEPMAITQPLLSGQARAVEDLIAGTGLSIAPDALGRSRTKVPGGALGGTDGVRRQEVAARMGDDIMELCTPYLVRLEAARMLIQHRSPDLFYAELEDV